MGIVFDDLQMVAAFGIPEELGGDPFPGWQTPTRSARQPRDVLAQRTDLLERLDLRLDIVGMVLYRTQEERVGIVPPFMNPTAANAME